MNPILDLQKKLVEFRDEREWKQFHDPINLAVALQLEVSEVLECFQWKANTKKFDEWYSDPENKKALTHEVADVFSYLLLLAEALDIDIVKATEEKIAHNAAKYPVDKSKGNSLKYNKL
ncbi:MAG TPA: nucleotide pyrophosphohydrolase [Patescibacteria group bacterium]|nr:nucleotide pyrophosphohydrolase [Patescibacteria group bacterium]